MSANGGEDKPQEGRQQPSNPELKETTTAENPNPNPNPPAPMVQPQYNPYFSAPGAMWQNYWQPAQPHPHPVTGMQMAYMQQQPINANAAMYYQQPQSSSAGAPVPERAAGTSNVKNLRGRPKKRKSTDKDPDYLPPDTKETQSSLEIPKRTALDVSIADSNRTKCAICSFWAGRYFLAPCYHYSFYIECIEKSVNQKSPVCPVCSTPIEKIVLGYRSTITNTLSDYEDD